MPNRPRIDKDILREHCEGLIALSGCLKGEIPYAVYHDQLGEAEKAIEEYIDIFGKEVSTIKPMLATKEWLDWAFTSWHRDRETTIINSSEGGILRDHCLQIPLKNFIEANCREEYNIAWRIKKLL